MPTSDFYIEPRALDPARCAQVRAAMDRGEAEAAEIVEAGIRLVADVRRTHSIEVDDTTLAAVEAHLEDRRATLAGHFGVTLAEREGAGFLRYGPGGFYRAHRDRAHLDAWPDAARRLVAVVLFLSSSRQADPAGTFSGGTLVLHDARPSVRIDPRAGTLVAFPADMLHEVEPVEAGIRDAVVDWFYAPIQP